MGIEVVDDKLQKLSTAKDEVCKILDSVIAKVEEDKMMFLGTVKKGKVERLLLTVDDPSSSFRTCPKSGISF
jgi:hypothetical protein